MHRRVRAPASASAPGADPIRVTFALQYGDELSQAERAPIVSCYFSAPVEGTVVDVPVPEDNASGSTMVTLEGMLASGTLLPADTQICFYATCERTNDFGVPCRVAAGIGMISLSYLASSANSNLQVSIHPPTTRFQYEAHNERRVPPFIMSNMFA